TPKIVIRNKPWMCSDNAFACGVIVAVVTIATTPGGVFCTMPTTPAAIAFSPAASVATGGATRRWRYCPDGGKGATGFVRHNDPGTPASRTRRTIVEPAGMFIAGK